MKDEHTQSDVRRLLEEIQSRNNIENVFNTTIGSNARNFAVGKNFIQVNQEVAVAQPESNEQISVILTRLFNSLEGASVSERDKGRAEVHLETLREELLRSDGSGDAIGVSKAGDWLMKNVPALRSDLRTLLNLPAVQRMLADAGTSAQF